MKKIADVYSLTVVLCAFTLLAGCQANAPAFKVTSDTTEVYTKNRDFMIIRSRKNDSYQAIAKRYYGNSAEAFRLTEINPKLGKAAGQLVTIPLRMKNPANIYPGFYKTIPILCYHQFTDNSTSRHPLVLQKTKFKEQLQYLQDNHYQVLRLEDLELYLNGERPIPDKSVILTIDDGYSSIYSIAYPLLKEFNYPVTVFLYTDFIGAGAALNWDQINQLKKSGLFNFQSHSKTHSSLATLPNPDPQKIDFLRNEILSPDSLISKKLGTKPEQFAFPYGDSSDAAVSILRREGYHLALTVQAGGNPTFADPMRLRRAMIYDGDNMYVFKHKLTTRVSFQ
jgi:peptidoglycan/xylan/chitin deacetylase (PgdA/CDA1 family)